MHGWLPMGVTLGVAAFLIACGSSNNDIEKRCLDSVVPFVEASGEDTKQWLQEELAKGSDPETVGKIAEADVGLTEMLANAASEKCTVDPQAAFDALCNSPEAGYHERLWQNDWCR